MSRIGGWPKKRRYSRLKLACAFISNFEGRTRGIEPVDEYAVTGSMQSRLFLVLKWAHRSQGSEMVIAPLTILRYRQKLLTYT
jgi:hypothetical protein